MKQTSAQPSERARNPQHSKRIVWIIVAMLFVPMIVAQVMLSYGVFPKHTTNHGYLSPEPVAIPSQLVFNRQDSKPFTVEQLKGHWWIVFPHEGDCGKACQKAIHDIRQINAALGKYAYRVRRLYVSDLPANAPLAQALRKNYPHMALASADLSGVTQKFFAGSRQNVSDDHLFVVDPMGNMILSYRLEQADHALLGDLKHLLKVSNIG